jgi:Spc7 kinetochore protein
MDELSAPWRSALPSQLSAQRRAPVQTTESALAGYVVAMAVVAPQLKLYSHVATDLQRWIEHSKEIYREAEAEAAKVTPMLFREYLMADGQMQAELLVSLISSIISKQGVETDVFVFSHNSSLSRPMTMRQRNRNGMIGGCSG